MKHIKTIKSLSVFACLIFLSACASNTGDNTATRNTSDNQGVLVLGGTGQLGSYHVKQLSDAGERVIVLARTTSSFERLEGSDYEVVMGDLRNESEVMAAVMESKPAVIIDTSNYPGIRFEDGESFYWPSMRYQIAAARAAGVTQIIRHSPRGARQMLTQPPSEGMRSDPLIINYMRDGARAELALEQAGVEGSLAATIIYNRNLPPEPAGATGRGELLADLTVDGGITRSDLARLTNTCILNEKCYGSIFNAVDAYLQPPNFEGRTRPNAPANP
tara:strand:- start:148 stop:972 length:825 start_codon:yes stop_codon:yes gene_type:complete